MTDQSQQKIPQPAWELETDITKYDDFHRDCVSRIQQALRIAELTLEISTGHGEYERRKIGYYAVATYFTREFDPFPGMVIYGPPSTGKTMTLNVLKGTCYHSVSVTGETITPAALKACMSQSKNGTLIIEEADSMTGRDLEETLITRYSTASADNKKMVPEGKAWKLADYATFGATVAHRRNLFRDPAMLRRVITVKTRRTKGDFTQVTTKSHEALFRNFHKLMGHHPQLPQVRNQWDIEPGVFDCYKPLIALVVFIEDWNFLNGLISEMKDASSHLREEETYLEPQMLLKALIALAAGKVNDKPTTKLINIEVRLIDSILRDEFTSTCPVFQLSANQRNRIIRENLGFQVKSSHGRMRVYFTIPQLIHVCRELNIDDECLEEWEKALSQDS